MKLLKCHSTSQLTNLTDLGLVRKLEIYQI